MQMKLFLMKCNIHIATGIVTLSNCVRGTLLLLEEKFSNTTASSHLAVLKFWVDVL
jgi:hypothetical protein